jgi:hypothetical protein
MSLQGNDYAQTWHSLTMMMDFLGHFGSLASSIIKTMKHWLWLKHKPPTFLHFLKHFPKELSLNSSWDILDFLFSNITTKSKSLATLSTQTNFYSFNFDIWYLFVLRIDTFFVSSSFKILEKSFGIRTTLVFGLVTLVSKNLGALSIELHNEPSNSTNVV